MNLYRSRRDRKITGLCGGLAEEMNLDPTILRLVLVVTAFISGGAVVLLYVVASLVIPKEPGMDFPGGYSGHGYGSPYGGAAGAYGPSGSQHSNAGSGYQAPKGTSPGAAADAETGHLDEMMKELEKKALEKEIEQLKAKLAKYEKGDE